MMTRKEMFERHTKVSHSREATQTLHNEYYRQFVTPEIFNVVCWRIGVDAIERSTDPHFNDIPLRLWDSFKPDVIRLCANLLVEAEEASRPRPGIIYISLSTVVCVAKQAARMYREGYRLNNKFQLEKPDGPLSLDDA